MVRESKLQKKCIDYLKSKKIYCLNLYGDGFSGKGKPDLLACIKGRFVAFELKVGYNDLQDDQKLHRIWIKRSGGLHYAPYTLEEFIEIVEDLLNG
jgi:hypothetical protein